MNIIDFHVHVRNQREEGWVPAMFLRKVEYGEALSSSPISGKMDELDILSFNGGTLKNLFQDSCILKHCCIGSALKHVT